MYSYPPQQPPHTQWGQQQPQWQQPQQPQQQPQWSAQWQQPPQWQPVPPQQPASMLHFKPGNVLALIGGVLAVGAYFLPMVSISLFGSTVNISMLTYATLQTPPLPADQPIYLLPLIAAIALAGFAGAAVLATNSYVNLLPAGAGAIGLVLMGMIFILLQGESAPSAGLILTDYLGIGFWGCAIGFLLGCIGGIIDLFR